MIVFILKIAIKDINLINNKIKQGNLQKNLKIIFKYEDKKEMLLNNISEFGNIEEEKKRIEEIYKWGLKSIDDE